LSKSKYFSNQLYLQNIIFLLLVRDIKAIHAKKKINTSVSSNLPEVRVTWIPLGQHLRVCFIAHMTSSQAEGSEIGMFGYLGSLGIVASGDFKALPGEAPDELPNR
jgi:hypothetical protein